MPTPIDQSRNQRRPRIAAAVPLLALASCAALSACGSSSPATTASRTATQSVTTLGSVSASSPATTKPATPANSTGHTGGTSPGSTNNGGSGGGNGNASSNHSPSPSQSSSSQHTKFPPAFVAAVKTFATCVRSHGLNIPEPNLSGHGEIFSRKGINPNNPSYHSAILACEGDLIAILRAAGGSHIPGIG